MTHTQSFLQATNLRIMKSFKPLQCYSTFHPGITGYERGWGVYGRKDHLLLSLYALVLILKSNLQNFFFF